MVLLLVDLRVISLQWWLVTQMSPLRDISTDNRFEELNGKTLIEQNHR